ncbi:MAG: DNA polymerase III subunit chi [Alphaproteobacteria bacterium]|nr:MAG: DNA polymerase III subunit chi [Alphaproteobacteria bacterium]
MTASGPEIWFYHLEQWTLDRALPPLLEKTRERGWRALVRGGVEERLPSLSNTLWTYRDDGFLPHGLNTEPHAERQPILLTGAQENTNQANVLFLIDQAERGDISDFGRCILVFDGNDPEALAAARAEWKRAKDEGLPVSYWQQGESGSFEKKA